MTNSRYFPGKTVGRLSLLRKENNRWLCRCSCGNEPAFHEADLAKVKSCGCIVILGLDVATTTGWAVRYSWKNPSAIKCGTFYVGENSKGDKISWEEKYALAANCVYNLIREHNPDFVAIEAPEHSIRRYGKSSGNKIDVAAIKAFIARLTSVMFKHGLDSNEAVGLMSKIGASTNNSNQMQLAGLVGSVIGVCMNMGVAFGTIGSRSWHRIYGDVKPSDGQDWKDIAIERCERDGIPLPRTKKEQRDAAEAVWISGYWTKCKLPNFQWVQDRFKALLTEADKIAAKRGSSNATHQPSDLFEGAPA